MFLGCGNLVPVLLSSPLIEEGGPGTASSGWELFPHDADIGLRGFGPTLEAAFEQVALALSAVISEPGRVAPEQKIEVSCSGRDAEFLLVEWLNTLVYEMATRRMLFGKFVVQTEDGTRLRGWAWGEAIDSERHQPAVEVKGATFTELKVAERPDRGWVAQCIVDV